MVSVLHVNKHLIKFPIALDYTALRGRNKMENSTDSTGCTKYSTMLLKTDTGTDVNLMNKQTFDQLFGLTTKDFATTDSYQDGKLWKFSSKSAWDVPCISEMKGQGLQTIILHY